LHCRFVATELSPREKRQTQIDDGRVERVDGLLQFQTKRFIRVQLTSVWYQDERSQRRSANRAPDSRARAYCEKLDCECPCDTACWIELADTLQYIEDSRDRSVVQKPLSKTDPNTKNSGLCNRRGIAQHTNEIHSEEQSPSIAQRPFDQRSSEASFGKPAKGTAPIRIKSIKTKIELNELNFSVLQRLLDRTLGHYCSEIRDFIVD